MRRVMVWMAGLLLATSTGSLRAQSSAQPHLQPRQAGAPTPNTSAPQGKLEGNWQGMLQLDGGASRRLLFKITEDDGKYKGVFYSIDQGPGATAMSSVALDGAKVSFEIKALDWTYTGTLNLDGNTITGSRTQSGRTNVLNLNHVSAENMWAVPEPPKSMPADAVPKFDVLTVKPSDPNTPGKLFTIRGRHVMTINTSVSDLITFAYGLHPKQLVNGPAWLDEKYDLDGVPDVEGHPNIAQMRLLIQDALATRFGLKFHHDQRELAVYALTVAKGGPKLTVTALPPSAAGRFHFSRVGTAACDEFDDEGFLRQHGGRGDGQTGSGPDRTDGPLRLQPELDTG